MFRCLNPWFLSLSLSPQVPKKHCQFGHRTVCQWVHGFSGFKRHCGHESCGKSSILGALFSGTSACGCRPVPVMKRKECTQRPAKRCKSVHKTVAREKCEKIPTNVSIEE